MRTLAYRILGMAFFVAVTTTSGLGLALLTTTAAGEPPAAIVYWIAVTLMLALMALLMLVASWRAPRLGMEVFPLVIMLALAVLLFAALELATALHANSLL